MKRITAFFLFVVLIISNSCQLFVSPSEPFYCKINGKAFRPGKDTSPIGGVGSSPLRVEMDSQNHWFYISTRNSPEYLSIVIKLNNDNIIEVGEYKLDKGSSVVRATYTYDYTSDAEFLDSESGKLILTKVSNNSVWGTFEFKTKSDKLKKDFIITKGQFNALRYK
jgi:Family of unknown function (DUF6252)